MLSARPDILQGEGDGPLIDKLLREMLRSENQSVSGVKKNAGFSKVCEILKVCAIESLKYI